MRIIIGISGATGVIMGYKLLQILRDVPDCETHLVLTEGALKNFMLETKISIDDVKKLAHFCYDNKNMAAAISSGSFKTDGMIVMPCSMKSLSGIANGYASTLLVRAVDVCLKENRKVVIVPREMPLGKIHIKNMAAAADLGCSIIPPMLTFYNSPDNLEDQVIHVIGKVLMQFNIDVKRFKAWKGAM
jgi:4-hydroxy-3-polyprenylbenzoate decarboxylase